MCSSVLHVYAGRCTGIGCTSRQCVETHLLIITSSDIINAVISGIQVAKRQKCIKYMLFVRKAVRACVCVHVCVRARARSLKIRVRPITLSCIITGSLVGHSPNCFSFHVTGRVCESIMCQSFRV